MITTFLAMYTMEIICGGTFLGGFSVYSYLKMKGKFNQHRLVYYDISDRVIKSKKNQQRISDRAGGGNKNDTFFKGSK